MAIAGHVSRRMLERYGRIRMEAKRSALKGLSGQKQDGEGYGTVYGTVAHSPTHLQMTTSIGMAMMIEAR